MNTLIKKETSSFRDPSGQIFWHDEKLYRTINNSYKKNFNWLINSKLYDELIKNNFLIPHKESSTDFTSLNAYKIIEPEITPFISYPYEWSFSQLKDAALLTLNIQKIALKYGMSLKDASAYNIQFKNGKPILIDTLSFEIYEKSLPWVAYKQFCQHFLAPLSLMVYTNVDLNKLFIPYIDGIPIQIASKLLPFKTHFKPSLKLHIHLHAKTQKKYENSTNYIKKTSRFTLTALKGLIDNLENSIKKLNWNPIGTEWANYYQDNSYDKVAIEHKKEIVELFLQIVSPKQVWDLGGNDGTFSRIAAKKSISVISFDIDPSSVEKNYLKVKEKKERNLLPLIIDLTNPSPSIGWNNQERKAILKRHKTDLIMALALIHHLAISNNVPMKNLALFFSQLSQFLIIEYIPKNDPKVQKLLATRKDIFEDYNEENFEETFSHYFEIKNKQKIKNSKRIIYLMYKK